MTGLVLTDEIVAPERDVVLEERRMHCDADPNAQLSEAVQATLFTHHPYGTPIIGWGHEIESLSRADALAYYARFYTPENAILSSPATPTPRRCAAWRSCTTARSARAARRRAPSPAEPPPVAPRLVVVNDEKVEQPSWQRCYLAPSHRTGAPGELETLDALAHLLGGGQTSLLYRKLVLEDKLAVAATRITWARRSTRRGSTSTPCRFTRVSLNVLDAAVDRVLASFMADGAEGAALERAKTRLVADAIYAQDSQATAGALVRRGAATGQTIATSRNGRSASRRRARKACWPRRANGSIAAARSPAFSCAEIRRPEVKAEVERT